MDTHKDEPDQSDGGDADGSIRLLRLMAKKGARGILEPDGSGVRVELAGDPPRLLDVVPMAMMEEHADSGWVVRGNDAGWHVTKKGRIALRRSLSRTPEVSAVTSHEPRVSGRVTRPRPPAAPRATTCESPLDWLHRRRDKSGEALITDEQHAAGERLRSDYWFAGLSPRVTASWSVVAPCTRGGSGNAGDLADNVLAARERVNRALAAVGPELSGVLVDVCCLLRGLEQVEQQNGWALRSAKVVLQLGLTALARHYGLNARPAGRPRTRHWGAPGYRPSLAEPDNVG